MYLYPRYLIDQFYSSGLSLGQRIDILDLFSRAAIKHSGINFDQKDTTSTQQPDAKQDQERIGTILRMSKKLQQNRVKTRSNKSGPVLAAWLFPLLGRFAMNRDSYNVFKDDTTILLQSMVRTCGVLVYCAMNTVEARQIAQEYFSFLWSLRGFVVKRQEFDGPKILLVPSSPRPDLVRELLFGFQVIFNILPDSILSDTFQDYWSSLQYWLAQVFESGTAEVQRDAAMVLKRREGG